MFIIFLCLMVIGGHEFLIMPVFRDAWNRVKFNIFLLVLAKAQAEHCFFSFGFTLKLKPNLTSSLITTNAHFESWYSCISHGSLAPCSFATTLSSFLFQLYGATSTAPSCKGMLKKETASMLSAAPCLTPIMMDVTMHQRLWSSKNVFYSLLKTAVKRDDCPIESAEPFLSSTIHIYICDISDYTGTPLNIWLILMFCSVFSKIFFRSPK